MTTIIPDITLSSFLKGEERKKPSVSSVRMKEALDCPLFLRKTYHMVDTSDPSIVGWTEDGDMFVVKDPEVFAAKVIPQFFKHSNFASFVRQLNFYGFRKIKSDPIKLDIPIDEKEAKYWKFRHRNFQRGRLDLLNAMRRKDAATDQPPPDDHMLKTEVDTLKERIDYMSHDIDKLTSLLERMIQLKDEEQKKVDAEPDLDSTAPSATEESTAEGGLKKRKVASLSSAAAVTISGEDNVLSGEECIPELEDIRSIEPTKVCDRQDSLNSLTASDQDFVNDLFNDLDIGEMDDSLPPLMDTFEYSSVDSPYNYGGLDPALSRRLNEAVATLPRELHEVFVDRLIATITSPEVYRTHMDAIMGNNSAPIKEAKNENYKEQQPQLRLAPTTAFRALNKQYGGPKNFSLVPVHA